LEDIVRLNVAGDPDAPPEPEEKVLSNKDYFFDWED